jgi:hypothetical protein
VKNARPVAAAAVVVNTAAAAVVTVAVVAAAVAVVTNSSGFQGGVWVNRTPPFYLAAFWLLSGGMPLVRTDPVISVSP